MTYMRAWMSLKFGEIRLLVSMAIDRVIMEKNMCCHFFSAVFYPILFIFASNDDMHESSEEFEFRPDPTTDCGFGLNIFIHINENKHINEHYITMVYDGIQKEAIRLKRICFPLWI